MGDPLGLAGAAGVAGAFVEAFAEAFADALLVVGLGFGFDVDLLAVLLGLGLVPDVCAPSGKASAQQASEAMERVRATGVSMGAGAVGE
jgi:hypothetical protein